MSVSAVVSNGQIVETTSQTSVSSSTSSTSGYDKESFLQLLVAQMKYQDPLEPTSNTEYISQYATFSQVEQLQNMAQSMDLSRASGLVGETVQISTTDSSGNTTSLEGQVEYVKYENGSAYVSIDGTLYSADDVTAVIDSAYSTAYELANSFADSVNSLPSFANLTLDDADTIEALRTGYNSLTSYQQGFIDDSYVELLEEYVAKIAEMQADAEAAAEAEAENAASEETEESSESTTTDSSEEISDETLDALLTDTE